jgi:hypothetical protein
LLEAADGNEAVLKSLELNPRLVINIAMPVLDGSGAPKKIKEALPEVLILRFSLNASPDIAKISHSTGHTNSSAKLPFGQYYWRP